MDVTQISGLPAGSTLRLVGGESTANRNAIHNAAPAEAPAAEEGEPASGSVSRAVSTLEAFTQSISRNLSFKLDDSTGRVVVKVTDAVSGEVIRQIPSEEALRLAESLEDARSLLFRAEA